MARINFILKRQINGLAGLFYRMHGYRVEDGYDFSKARHPQEKAMWNLAKLSYEFWDMASQPTKAAADVMDLVVSADVPEDKALIVQGGQVTGVITNIGKSSK